MNTAATHIRVLAVKLSVYCLRNVMAKVEKSVLVQFSAESMYNLVRDVPSYPKFLPWCGGSSLQPISEFEEKASVTIAFKGVKQEFTTLNKLTVNRSIDMSLINGPFKKLQGRWDFKPLDAQSCKVSFELEYEFSSVILSKLVGPIFSSIAKTFVENFIKRAENLHQKGLL